MSSRASDCELNTYGSRITAHKPIQNTPPRTAGTHQNQPKSTKIQKVILKALKVKLSIKYISKNYYIQKKELYFNHLSIRWQPKSYFHK